MFTVKKKKKKGELTVHIVGIIFSDFTTAKQVLRKLETIRL